MLKNERLPKTSLPSHNDYRIGIICALSIELAAIRAMLDEEHGRPKRNEAHDHNVYHLGRMHRHNIVIACLPASIDGTVAAASVAKDMVRTFSELRFVLLVGIGGGIPNLPHDVDIRLGDVVVSQPQNSHGGVIQYDKGKMVAGGRWEPHGCLNMPPTALLTALQSIQSDYELGESDMDAYLSGMLERRPKMADLGYAYPGVEKDVLYGEFDDNISSVTHDHEFHDAQTPTEFSNDAKRKFPGGRETEQKERLARQASERPYKKARHIENDITGSCESLDRRPVKLRHSRPSITPYVHYGIIASGNSVVKDARQRDLLRDQYNAKCVEMEAAGLMNEFPCLIIRGICDYADEHKNDEWHRYASCTAAAFAKELLKHVSVFQTAQAEPIVENPILDLHVFKTSDYEYHKNINSEAVPGTCRWVLEHPQYQDWSLDPNNSLLWISADPGCGKSVLSKALVDSFLRTEKSSRTEAPADGSVAPLLPDSIICYFFFKDNELQDTLATALCAIIHQLFSQQPQLMHHAEEAFRKNGDMIQKERDELWRILYDAGIDSRVRPVICVVDALDECRREDREYFIKLLSQANSHSTQRNAIKWLITSRPYEDIEQRFTHVSIVSNVIRLRGEDESDHIREEIDLVIRKRMSEIQHELGLSDNKVESLTDQLLAMQHRTYLWLYLAIDDIKSTFRYSLRPESESIITLPKSVEEAYEKILTRVNNNQTQRRHVKTILTVVVGARRAFTVSEMALALDVATRPLPPTSVSDLEINVTRLRTNIRQWCGLFVFLNHDRIYLLHQTAKEFLQANISSVSSNASTDSTMWRHSLDPPKVDLEMTKICVRVLNLGGYSNEPFGFEEYGFDEPEPYQDGTGIERGQLPDRQSLTKYAAENWAAHVHGVQALLDESTQRQILRLYDGYDAPDGNSILWVYGQPARHRRWEEIPAIHAAICNRHHVLLSHLLRLDHTYWMERDKCGREAVVLAAEQGDLAMVTMLLDAGADPVGLMTLPSHADGRIERRYALHAASSRGHVDVVKLLIQRGALIDGYTGASGTALQAASLYGQVAVVRALVEGGADVNLRGGGEDSAIKNALTRGHTKIVQILMDHGADPANHEPVYATSLHVAVADGNEARVERHIAAGADVDAVDLTVGTPLTLAAQKGYISIVRTLMRHGACVNNPDDTAYGELLYNVPSALYHAAELGNKELVELLLSAGADTSFELLDETPMSIALSYGHDDVFRMLFMASHAQRPDREYYSYLLHLAIYDGLEETVHMLLDHGADPNDYEYGEDTSLQKAARLGNPAIVRMLLEHGADVEVGGGYYGTALQTAVQMAHADVIRLLLDWGAKS